MRLLTTTAMAGVGFGRNHQVRILILLVSQLLISPEQLTSTNLICHTLDFSKICNPSLNEVFGNLHHLAYSLNNDNDPVEAFREEALSHQPISSYCEAGATSEEFEKIDSIGFHSIRNLSDSRTGYEDFTHVSTNVVQGQHYTFTARIGGAYDQDQILVWIDFNQNGSFTDAGEQVFVSSTGLGPHSSTIQVPMTASLGPTRMRVRLHDTGLGPNNTPCGNSQYGQVEDYTVVVGSTGCEDNMTLVSPTHNISGGAHKFELNHNITASNVISSGTVIYDAGIAVILHPNFTVNLGAEFTIQMDGCGNE